MAVLNGTSWSITLFNSPLINFHSCSTGVSIEYDFDRLSVKSIMWFLILLKSAFFHRWIVRLAGFSRFADTFEFMYTMSWSLMPGIGSHLFTSVGLFVMNKSRVFWFLVGKSTICSNSQLWSMLITVSLKSVRLKSPASHIVAFGFDCVICWNASHSDLI